MRQEYYFEAEPFEIYPELDAYEVFGTELADQEWQSEVNRKSRDYIKWVQRSLNQIMGLNLTVDGISGKKTSSAIRGFQQRQGLMADGIVGKKTEAAIKAASRSGRPTKTTSFRYVKGFSGPKAECTAALKRAGKTEAEAITIINTQIGVAISMLRKAAADLKRGKRSSATRSLFRQIFRVRPEFVPTWFKPSATIKDRGDVVATRCKRVADLLASGRIKLFCTINSTNCPDCGNDPSDFACSSWGDESVAPGRSNVVCLGNAFWDDMKAGRTSSLLSTLMHEPFHIYYGRYVTEHRSDAGKFGGINCIVQFVFETNGRATPARVGQRCKDTVVRNELDEISEETVRRMGIQGAGATGSGVSKCFTVNGFGYTDHELTSEQILLIKNYAIQIFNGSPPLPPLALVKTVLIEGYSSGTRRLEYHANRRRDSVIKELKKQLIKEMKKRRFSPRAVSGDIAKIITGYPVTKPVASRTDSDPRFRKVEICVIA